jgi:hypothetical protein
MECGKGDVRTIADKLPDCRPLVVASKVSYFLTSLSPLTFTSLSSLTFISITIQRYSHT